ncbi:MAG: META domain-containing protein [Pseudomonadota bacterium]|nr:META domain-containing protein [Pseudomonadota bacterium]
MVKTIVRPLAALAMSSICAAALAADAVAIPEQTALLERLQNGRYSGVYEQPVQLENGRFEGEPFEAGGASRPIVTLVEGAVAYGDLNGDGREDAVAFLGESSGGSGMFTYLAAVTADSQGDIPALLLGDRVQVRSFGIRDGQLVIDLVSAGPDEAACCPTLKLSKSYRLRDGALAETGAEELGQLSIADLEEVEWRLTHLQWRQPVPDGVKITAQFKDDKVAGSAGCNRYFASVEGDGPREIVIGQSGATRMMCPPPVMEQEDKFLAALQKVTGFSFIMARLALTYQDDDGMHTMLFAPER